MKHHPVLVLWAMFWPVGFIPRYSQPPSQLKLGWYEHIGIDHSSQKCCNWNCFWPAAIKCTMENDNHCEPDRLIALRKHVIPISITGKQLLLCQEVKGAWRGKYKEDKHKWHFPRVLSFQICWLYIRAEEHTEYFEALLSRWIKMQHACFV